MRSGAKVAVVGSVFLAVASGVGYGAYNVWNGISSGNVGGDSRTTKATGPLTQHEVEQVSREFLSAWAGGHSYKAAQLTNNAVEAEPILAGYTSTAHVRKAVITPGPAAGTKVPFTVNATIAYEGSVKQWSYSSELVVVRGLTTGRPLVEWRPTVIHPNLKQGDILKTGTSEAPEIKAVDNKGRELTRAKYPSLGTILDRLREKYGKTTDGEPGVELYIDSADEQVPDRSLLILAKGKPGVLKTTIDADVQAAAEAAVSSYGESSVVAINSNTGEIRAVANNRKDGFNAAFEGSQAPGSTMKIVTAAMMMDQGIVAGPSSKVECPGSVAWDGRTFHNLKDFNLSNATLQRAFARSCNTTFIKPVKPLNEKGVAGTALGETARKYFGVGEVWRTGATSTDASVPPSTGADTAASYIGQGKITMNALTIASIAATVKSGSFSQPIIVAKDLDGRKLATAQPLPDSIGQGLRAMMRAAATGEGTGAGAMSSVRGDKGAKTGSAEVDGQGTSNGWFTAFAGDLAAAAVVQSGGHGGDAAGAIVAGVLQAR
ncbi:penicillin-binding transpeptidase domain-containing protein [Streptomyces sp. NRRL B-24572]|uniref:penicillin-binding transpeptidase domain-containing protein n=1 Tax=Streptomyces sp. NRRL B-24572 TaxID=1962156 RepID=UPI000A3CA1E3|nr:penicillin-binding transpeptidase domain-containing protein [Streptomyces sp. NRRL B-24572]